MPDLLNNSARVISFMGGHAPTRKHTRGERLGFRCVPLERVTLSDAQVNAIKSNPTQSRVMRAYLDVGDLVDVGGVFGDLPRATSAPARAVPRIDPVFDSTVPPVVSEDDFTPPTPARADESEPEPASAPARAHLDDLSLDAAFSVVAQEDSIETLVGWLKVEKRADVRNAINDRGNVLFSKSKK